MEILLVSVENIGEGGINVKVITTFPQKRRERQIRFERSLMRELSIETLRTSFRWFFDWQGFMASQSLLFAIEEGCYDIAVETFLFGSQFSRLGYFGVPWEEIHRRSQKQLSLFSRGLADFIHYWVNENREREVEADLLDACSRFVEYWFREGFLKGKMKYKMKLL